MRLGSRNRRQGDRRNRQMFLKQPGGGEPVFSEKDQATNPHRKRESQHHLHKAGQTQRTKTPVDMASNPATRARSGNSTPGLDC
jgi:hypothetical protein